MQIDAGRVSYLTSSANLAQRPNFTYRCGHVCKLSFEGFACRKKVCDGIGSSLHSTNVLRLHVTSNSTTRGSTKGQSFLCYTLAKEAEGFVEVFNHRQENVGVLLLNLGGPETLKDVQPFLYNLFADPDIIRLPRLLRFLQQPLAKFISMMRAPKSMEGYAAIGGGSPLRRITEEQECYGDGCGILDSKSEKTGPQVATERAEAVAAERAEAHTGCHFSHKVREGDTLTSIANKYKVTVHSIALPNEIADVDYIPAGKSLLIPNASLKSCEVYGNADGSSSLMASQGSECQSVVVHTESSLSRLPVFASSFSFQTWHVRLALFLVLLFSLSSFLKRCISDLRTRRHEEVLRYQVEKEVQDSHHQPKLRRWQGILDDDRRIDEDDGELFTDGPILDAEEEKLRQSYAQLESVYVKFLADSGLSKSGYWRGGTPPALEEK